MAVDKAEVGIGTMEIRVKTQGNQVRFSLEGKLDIETCQEFNAQVEARITGGSPDVVVDLGGLEYIDSSGLGGLIKAFNHVQGCNGRFCLANPAGPIQAILEISGATAYLEVLSAESYAERYGALDGAG